jgi:acyl-CoA synthetase (AMP-forming)/AMP-acid ligase II
MHPIAHPITAATNLGCVIDRSAGLHKPALIGVGPGQTERTASFGQIDALADGIARGLMARGFAVGDRIALLAANSIDYVAAVLGIMRAGLVAVPVNFKFPAELVAFVLSDSGARLVFCDGERALQLPAGVDAVDFADPAFKALVQPGPFIPYEPSPADAALILYTSGSSGRPKGVRLSHASHLWVVRTRQAATPLTDERALIAAPLYHMNALALVLLTLASHATAVLLPQFSAAAYVAAIDRHRCTWLTAVPPMIAMMLREKDALARADLGSVRVVRMGSAPVSASLLQQIRQVLPNARVINAYGTTEGGPVVFGPHPQGLPTPAMSVGYPHPQVQTRLIDDGGREADLGILQIKSPGLMLGYHQRPELKPFTDDGFYVTGDVFQRDADGFHTFVGRRDDMFVSGGENIYPGEVEKMLERHPAVQQASVVPVEDEIKGHKPVAFVVLRAGQPAPTEDEIKAFALQNAAAYQHPRRVWFVDSLPLAATNKIDRRALVALASERIKA